jgi:hypothetical protein
VHTAGGEPFRSWGTRSGSLPIYVKPFVRRQKNDAADAEAIAEAILEGRQPVEMTLAALMEPFPVVWHEQKLRFV